MTASRSLSAGAESEREAANEGTHGMARSSQSAAKVDECLSDSQRKW